MLEKEQQYLLDSNQHVSAEGREERVFSFRALPGRFAPFPPIF